MNEMKDNRFWDSNLWIYLYLNSSDQEDIRKRSILRSLIQEECQFFVSAQVFNEVANVLIKKYFVGTQDIKNYLQAISSVAHIIPLDENLSYAALDINTKYQLSWYDSLIVASSLQANCHILYSEDLHNGLVLEGKMRVINPFV